MLAMNISNKEKFICIPFLVFLFFFILIPFIIIIIFSFKNGDYFSIESLSIFFTDISKISSLLKSIFVAVQATIICLFLSYPIAYFLAEKNIKNIIVVSIFAIPMAINFILKAATIRDLLLLMHIGNSYPYLSTIIGMVYNFLPFAIFPLYNNFLKIDKSQSEAASDLGASPLFVFFYNVIPQTTPGIVSAMMMVFTSSISSYVMYDIFSEGKIISIGNVISTSFMNNQWNIGCFSSCVMLLVIFLLSFLANYLNSNNND